MGQATHGWTPQDASLNKGLLLINQKNTKHCSETPKSHHTGNNLPVKLPREEEATGNSMNFHNWCHVQAQLRGHAIRSASMVPQTPGSGPASPRGHESTQWPEWDRRGLHKAWGAAKGRAYLIMTGGGALTTHAPLQWTVRTPAPTALHHSTGVTWPPGSPWWPLNQGMQSWEMQTPLQAGKGEGMPWVGTTPFASESQQPGEKHNLQRDGGQAHYHHKVIMDLSGTVTWNRSNLGP